MLADRATVPSAILGRIDPEWATGANFFSPFNKLFVFRMINARYHTQDWGGAHGRGPPLPATFGPLSAEISLQGP